MYKRQDVLRTIAASAPAGPVVRRARPRRGRAQTEEAATHTAEQVRDVVRSAVLSLVGEDDIDEDATLMDEGLDSLGATELSGKLAAELGVRVAPTLIFSYPTMRLIREHMEELLGLSAAPESASAQSYDAFGADLQNDVFDVAVVGVACEYPGDARDIDSFWSVRRDGVDAMGEAPWSRWDTDSILAPLQQEDRENLNRMRYGAFLLSLIHI